MSEREEPIRLAVVGGRRGSAFKHALDTMPHRVVLTAVCELNESVLREWQAHYPGIKAYNSYDKLLDDPGIDAVLLATPLLIHAPQYDGRQHGRAGRIRRYHLR